MHSPCCWLLTNSWCGSVSFLKGGSNFTWPTKEEKRKIRSWTAVRQDFAPKANEKEKFSLMSASYPHWQKLVTHGHTTLVPARNPWAQKVLFYLKGSPITTCLTFSLGGTGKPLSKQGSEVSSLEVHYSCTLQNKLSMVWIHCWICSFERLTSTKDCWMKSGVN